MPTHTNPFPGMNPYFQTPWNRVHTRLSAYASRELLTVIQALSPSTKADADFEKHLRAAGLHQ